jgi:hypothetical protein
VDIRKKILYPKFRVLHCTSLVCTGLSGVHQTVSSARLALSMKHAALGKKPRRRGYISLDCPVGQPRAQLTVDHAISERHVAQPTVSRRH